MIRLGLLALITLLPALHTRLARSDPPAAASTVAPPRTLRLWFEGGVEAAFTQVTLHGSNGARLALGAPSRGEEEGLVVVPVPLVLTPDTYTVRWETVGRDGHAVRGEFGFLVTGAAPGGARPPARLDSTAWGAGATGRTVTGGGVISAPDAPAASTQSPAQYSSESRPVRWVELAALTLALGAVALLLLVLRTGGGSPAHERFVLDATRRVRLLSLWSAALFLVATGARFALESHTLHKGVGGLSLAGLLRTAGTGWGRAWCVTAIAMLVLLLTLAMQRRRAAPAGAQARTAGKELALGITALLAAMGPATTGHAAGAAALMPLAVFTDWLHVIGAAAWIGGVAGLALAAAPAALTQPPGERAPALAWLLGAFHAVAVPASALVVCSGLVSAWLRIGSWAALTKSNYGDLLMLKVVLVGIVMLLGAHHWHRAHPRLSGAAPGDDQPAHRLRWTLSTEFVVGIIVLALTAALVTMQPPR